MVGDVTDGAVDAIVELALGLCVTVVGGVTDIDGAMDAIVELTLGVTDDVDFTFEMDWLLEYADVGVAED